MLTLTSRLIPPTLFLGPYAEPQLCYVLLEMSAHGTGERRPVNWAIVADASRSMRIPIVDDQQFRDLIRSGGAQETVVDGVPVWQLSGPVPPEVRDAASSALDHVAHALHTIVERLDRRDRVALVACAEEAVLLLESTAGDQRVALVEAIDRLKRLRLGDQTDLAQGLSLALAELSRQHADGAAHELLLLTDGFTLRPEACLQLASRGAAAGVTITTLGLGGEFQEQVLTALADHSSGRAFFLRNPYEIPHAIARELDTARSPAVQSVSLLVEPLAGTQLYRLTRIRPALAPLYEHTAGSSPAGPKVHLGDLASSTPVLLLIELLVPPGAGKHAVAHVRIESHGAPATTVAIEAHHTSRAVTLPGNVADAAARATVARLQQRATDALAADQPAEAARLLRAAASRLHDLGEHALAEIAQHQAATIEQTGQTEALASKELAYATRRIGTHLPASPAHKNASVSQRGRS